MRLLVLLLALGVAACGEAEAGADTTPVECALGGSAAFAPDCTMERAEVDGQRTVIVRHPDGGFRRFELGVPERGIITADGMEQADVTRSEGIIELRVGADRYRLPVAD
ncbi:MAG: hypothetical protein JY451_13070 [Erythrobacter sp.]|nr:MAG: hypothetical protein JY451_13070 [Erythrobacter sp.]